MYAILFLPFVISFVHSNDNVQIPNVADLPVFPGSVGNIGNSDAYGPLGGLGNLGLAPLTNIGSGPVGNIGQSNTELINNGIGNLPITGPQNNGQGNIGNFTIIGTQNNGQGGLGNLPIIGSQNNGQGGLGNLPIIGSQNNGQSGIGNVPIVGSLDNGQTGIGNLPIIGSQDNGQGGNGNLPIIGSQNNGQSGIGNVPIVGSLDNGQGGNGNLPIIGSQNNGQSGIGNVPIIGSQGNGLGGFNQNNGQGGFNQNNGQGGFNQNNGQGGFNQNNEFGIERPCQVFDIYCIRRYFKKYGKCKEVHGPVPEPYFRAQSSLQISRINATFSAFNVLYQGLNGRINEFYINRNTDRLVISIEFRNVTFFSRDVYYRFYRRGREPITTYDYLYLNYKSYITTTIIPKVRNLQLYKSETTTFTNDAIPSFSIGPNAFSYPDSTVQLSRIELLKYLPIVVQEAQLTEGPFSAATFIQNNICDFKLKVL